MSGHERGAVQDGDSRRSRAQLNTGTNFGDGPTGVVIGPDGHYYVAELGARAVIRVDAAAGAETVVSQGGHLVSPSGIAVAADGRLLLVDHDADKVIDVEAEGGVLVVDLVGDKLIRIEPDSGTQTVIAQGGPLAGIRSVAVVGA